MDQADNVTQPMPAIEAFSTDGREAEMVQAASLLILGLQLRGDVQAWTARSLGLAKEDGVDVDYLPQEDLDEIGHPPLAPIAQLSRATRSRLTEHDAAVSRLEDEGPGRLLREEAAIDFYKDPSHTSAAVLLATCNHHPNELVRVAAASSYFHLADNPSRLLETIIRGTYSEDALTKAVAATALARIAPEAPRLRDLEEGGEPMTGGGLAHTAVMVHGTFARNAAWWRPGGDFHDYLRDTARPDLYGGTDAFYWSGGYSDGARALGALDLRRWLADHAMNGPALFTHSHGGSVAMLASRSGLETSLLAFLSCPVHIPKYVPEFRLAGRVVSIRVRLDLAILADRGGQRFYSPQIEENVLPLWFNHFATHDPAVWERFSVAEMVR